MANVDLSAARLRELLNYEPATGVFTWKVSKGTRARPGDITGTLHPTTFYLVIGIDGKLFQAHRLAWLYVHGKWPDADIDHRNGDRTDNRIANLRDVSRRINTENRRKSQGKSALMGVHWNPRIGWFSRIKSKGKVFYLGCHPTEQAAHEAYVKAKRSFHEGCTI